MAILLLVAVVLAKNAHAVVMDDLSRQQIETGKIKSELEDSQKENKTLEAEAKKDADKIKKLQKENADLKAKRQAKLEAERKAQEQRRIQQSTPRVQSVPVSGSCSEWLAKAGVTDISNAMWLINKESGCNPNAVNPSSGACGVAQELPCGKSGCKLGDGACQIRWMQNYVNARYGSWAGAVSFHHANGWY